MSLFKIDLRIHSSSYPFGLFVQRRGFFRTTWEEVEYFKTREEAKEFHEKIKDLPEFL